MNYKILLALFAAVLITVTFVVFSRARSIVPGQSLQSSVITAAPDQQVNNQLVSNSENSFMPIIADDKAPANATDVLIAAGKAAPAPALAAGQWINSAPLNLESLRGRVVLVDFWTFGCYNCRNTLPSVKKFDAAYREKGLTIIGVHTPESDYEKDLAKVQDAVKANDLKYPIVTDTDGETWRAYGIEAWPTVVILDRQGRVRYSHVGEGAYDVQEKVIQTLLAEKGEESSVASNDEQYNGQKIVKTEAEWRQQLTPQQFHILREQGTDVAFTGALTENHEDGDYYCAACHLKLFSSQAKFESGTGWPSFYQPVNATNITVSTDTSLGMTRDEVECSRCHSHLGHVFDDGPKPTGLRYCMNSSALTFEKRK